MSDLFKPDVKVTPTSEQRVLCNEQQDLVVVTDRAGGCYGIDCNECILEGNNIKAFMEWTNSNQTTQTTQHDLFG